MPGHITQRSKGSWSIKYELPTDAMGKRRSKWETVRGTKKDAERALRERLGDLDHGTYCEPSKTTLAEFLPRWLDQHAVSVRASTASDYRIVIHKHVMPRIGNKQLAKLTASGVAGLYASLQRDGVGPHRVKRTHIVLKAALAQAVKWDELGKNPCDKVDAPKLPHREMVALDGNYVRALLNVVRGTDDEGWIGLCVHTGLRRSELLGLRWSADVNLEVGYLTVQQSRQRVPNGGIRTLAPKTKQSRRRVDLASEAVQILRRQHARQAECRLQAGPAWANDGDLVFTRPDGTGLSPDYLSHTFARLARQLRLPTTRLHDLRHAHASLMLSAGVHAKVLSERLGHASIGITMDLYSHVLPGVQKAAAEAFERVLAAEG